METTFSTWPRWRCPSAARCLPESVCRCLPCAIPPTLTNVTNIHQSCNAWMTPESDLRCLTRSARLCPRRSVSKCQGKSVNLGPSRFAKRWLRLFMVSTFTTIKMLTAHWPISSSRPWLSMIVWYYLVMFPDPVPMGRSQDGNLFMYYHVSNKQVEKQHCQEVKKQKCRKVFFSFKTFHFNDFLDCHSCPKFFSSQTLIIFLIVTASQN